MDLKAKIIFFVFKPDYLNRKTLERNTNEKISRNGWNLNFAGCSLSIR